MTILDKHPEYLAFQAEREKAKVDRDAWHEERAKIQKAYEVACVAAMEGGTQIPDPPSPANSGEMAYRMKLDNIAAREREWMSDNFDELEQAVFEREDAIVACVAAMLAEIDAFSDEMGNLRGLHNHMRRAVTPGEVCRTAGTSFEVLLAAGRHDLRMLREPLVPNRCAFGPTDQSAAFGGGVMSR